jgi:hypothetical protein
MWIVIFIHDKLWAITIKKNLNFYCKQTNFIFYTWNIILLFLGGNEKKLCEFFDFMIFFYKKTNVQNQCRRRSFSSVNILWLFNSNFCTENRHDKYLFYFQINIFFMTLRKKIFMILFFEEFSRQKYYGKPQKSFISFYSFCGSFSM